MGWIQILSDSGDWEHMGGLGMGAFGWFFMTTLLVLVVWLGARRWSQPEPPSRRRALDVLDNRYASGEIERDEYLQRKSDLER